MEKLEGTGRTNAVKFEMKMAVAVITINDNLQT
jgi:hypothetical protein